MTLLRREWPLVLGFLIVAGMMVYAYWKIKGEI